MLSAEHSSKPPPSKATSYTALEEMDDEEFTGFSSGADSGMFADPDDMLDVNGEKDEGEEESGSENGETSSEDDDDDALVMPEVDPQMAKELGYLPDELFEAAAASLERAKATATKSTTSRKVQATAVAEKKRTKPKPKDLIVG